VEDEMKKGMHRLVRLVALLGVASLILSGTIVGAHSQQTAARTAAQQTQQPDRQSPSQPGQTPDQAQPAPESQNQVQIFSGTIVKSGTTYQLRDSAGKMYDLDQQDLVKKYEGRQVRVKGILDPDGKTIHIK
jgi:Protein of unknown function (DUF5818)